MYYELEAAHSLLLSSSARDIFGEEPVSKQAIYQDLLKVTDPNLYLNDLDALALAKEARGFLEQKWAEVKVVPNKAHKYSLGKLIEQGQITSVYEVHELSSSDTVYGRVAHEKKDNSFVRSEITSLKRLFGKQVPQLMHLPEPRGEFYLEDKRLVSLSRPAKGYSIKELLGRQSHINGIDPKHVVWMMNRALSAIGYAHSRLIVHCNLSPENLFIRPHDHNLWITDWSFSIVDPPTTKQQYKVYNDGFSAPEVRIKATPAPEADIFSLGKCFVFALGGDVRQNTIPDHVPVPLKEFVLSMTKSSLDERPKDAWNLHSDLIKVVEALWGPRKFLVFHP